MAIRMTDGGTHHDRMLCDAYAAILSTANIMVVGLDQAGAIVAANNRVRSVLGGSKEDLVGRNWFEEFTVADQRDSAVSVHKAVLADGQPRGVEYQVVPLDGPPRMISWQKSIMSTPDGDVSGTAALGVDVTDRVTAERALRDSEQMLSDSQRYGHVGGFMFDIVEDWWTSTEVMDEIFGIDEAFERTAEGWLSIVRDDHRQEMTDYLAALLRDRTLFDKEYPISRVSDGASRWVHGRGRLRLDEQGAPIMLIGTIRDVTDIHEAMDKLREHQARLRALAAELARSEDRERRRIAVELHDRVSQNLAAAKLRVSIALEAESPDTNDGLCVALGLIDEALAESRLLTSELAPPVVYELGLASALGWLVDMSERRHGLKCRLSTSGCLDELPEVTEVLLFRSARELLTNVVKHSGVLEANILLACRDNVLELEVSDLGRGGEIEGKGFGGTGFGLISIRESVESAGGTMLIKMARGQGTRVILTIPMRSTEDRVSGSVLE